MREARISVIIPVYKAEPYIRKCLDSIVGQTHRNLEIILVDDGSPDNCGAVCEEYAAQDDRIKVIHKENGGAASARNAGLAAASGEWVGWVDADDWIEAGMFEYLLKLALQHKADVAQCAICLENGEHSSILFAPPEKDTAKGLSRRNWNIFSNGVSNKLYRMSVVHGASFDSNYPIGEDLLFNVQVALRTKQMVFGPAAYYHYIHWNESASHKPPTLNMLRSIRCTSLRAVELSQGQPEMLEHFQRELLRNNMDVCSKIVLFYRPEFAKLKDEIRRELRANSGKIMVMEGLSLKDRGKLLLIAWLWKVYRTLLLGQKKVEGKC